MTKRSNWIDVDLDGLRKILDRRGKEFALFELISNAWDENVSRVDITLTRPTRGVSMLKVVDDSPEGFRDLTDAFTMFAESYKKTNEEKRGRFNLGEKFVLALCTEATITSTKGQVIFSGAGRKMTKHTRETGTEFVGYFKLTIEEYDRICGRVKLLIPEIDTIFNGEMIPRRRSTNHFSTTLATVTADSEGQLHSTKRSTNVDVYEPLPGEKAMLYEMGIPVVETGDSWHVDIWQKVPLNMERDNVTPAYLNAVRVAVLNASQSLLTPELATETWVRAAASHPSCSNDAITTVMHLRFGANRVSYDPSDTGSNREAMSKDYTVITGGSLSAGEWENAKRAAAIKPAGQLFPTNHGSKVPDKVYDRSEWDAAMKGYAKFVEDVTPTLVGHKVTLRYINDRNMVCGQFFDTYYNVNLAKHDASDWQSNIELMLHELAHTVVRSNDHLTHEFYETVGTLGARLAIIISKNHMCFGGVFDGLRPAAHK